MNLATPLYASAAEQQMAQTMQTQMLKVQELNQKIQGVLNIAQKIAAIDKTTKNVKKGKAIIIALVVGGVVTDLGLRIATLTGSAISTLIFPPAGAAAVTASTVASFAADAVIDLLIGSTITLLIAGGAGLLTKVIFGQLTAESFLAAYIDAKKLGDMEKANPGTLTEQQKTVLTRFTHELKGSFGKGIIKGIQLRKAKQSIAADTLKANPTLVVPLGGEKKAQKFVQKYLDDSRELNNKRIAYKNNKDQEQVLKTKRNKHDLLSLKRVPLNLKITALDLQDIGLKARIAFLEKKLNTIHQKYSGFAQELNKSAQAFIQQADQLIQELAKAIQQK
jgi:hypothetical protein